MHPNKNGEEETSFTAEAISNGPTSLACVGDGGPDLISELATQNLSTSNKLLIQP